MRHEDFRIERSESLSLADEAHHAFLTCVDDINKRSAVILMLTFYPQRGNLMEEAAKAGARCLIIGGKEGEREYPHVPQIGLPGMDAGAVGETYENAVRIVRAIPLEAWTNDGIAWKGRTCWRRSHHRSLWSRLD